MMRLKGAGLVALLVGIATFGIAGVALAGITEDVTQHNGQALHDSSRLHFFVTHRPDLLVSAAKVLTTVGALPVLVLVAVAVGLLMWWRGLALALAVAPIVALGIAALCAAVMKTVVDRSRPPVSLHLVHEQDASFPSGHATHSTALLLTIGLVLAVAVFRRPIARIAVVAGGTLLATLIGLSRLVLGVHWPTDVLAGWALGGAVALAVVMSFTLLARPSAANPNARRESRLRWLSTELTRTRQTRPVRATQVFP